MQMQNSRRARKKNGRSGEAKRNIIKSKVTRYGEIENSTTPTINNNATNANTDDNDIFEQDSKIYGGRSVANRLEEMIFASATMSNENKINKNGNNSTTQEEKSIPSNGDSNKLTGTGHDHGRPRSCLRGVCVNRRGAGGVDGFISGRAHGNTFARRHSISRNTNKIVDGPLEDILRDRSNKNYKITRGYKFDAKIEGAKEFGSGREKERGGGTICGIDVHNNHHINGRSKSKNQVTLPLRRAKSRSKGTNKAGLRPLEERTERERHGVGSLENRLHEMMKLRDDFKPFTPISNENNENGSIQEEKIDRPSNGQDSNKPTQEFAFNTKTFVGRGRGRSGGIGNFRGRGRRTSCAFKLHSISTDIINKDSNDGLYYVLRKRSKISIPSLKDGNHNKHGSSQHRNHGDTGRGSGIRGRGRGRGVVRGRGRVFMLGRGIETAGIRDKGHGHGFADESRDREQSEAIGLHNRDHYCHHRNQKQNEHHSQDRSKSKNMETFTLRRSIKLPKITNKIADEPLEDRLTIGYRPNKIKRVKVRGRRRGRNVRGRYRGFVSSFKHEVGDEHNSLCIMRHFNNNNDDGILDEPIGSYRYDTYNNNKNKNNKNAEQINNVLKYNNYDDENINTSNSRISYIRRDNRNFTISNGLNIMTIGPNVSISIGQIIQNYGCVVYNSR